MTRRDQEDYWVGVIAIGLATPLVIFLFGLALYFIGPHR